MRLFRRLLGLTSLNRHLIIEAAIWVVFVRGGLWVLPYRTLSAFLERRCKAHFPNRSSVEDIVWAVAAVSRYVPRATCLTQALAAQTLLRENGHSAILQIGVAKTPDNRFQAHAWVEGNGQVLLGGTEPGKYTPLLK